MMWNGKVMYQVRAVGPIYKDVGYYSDFQEAYKVAEEFANRKFDYTSVILLNTENPLDMIEF